MSNWRNFKRSTKTLVKLLLNSTGGELKTCLLRYFVVSQA